ncbi:type I-E CRISPR-associated protein Cas7/Cse4/CasC [Streptomyces mobaraensis NBRC 13819 = DSM 40847]|uniref:CRISPR-associated protein Cas4 n=1 Tax=Streptomyces mobaraensis (strain ATCC 29032 / DSM 40847 / JCM 4168 / NBRC 13819 / NCIMB 11159 / IPCR 16-22) TaxID=1223523 RepID=M3B7S8_STRM1|nr:type I-E CRISPR-associated protein Cas7/Cse4/CasC [Streptomyces mobaraensis]EMF02058.1 CRISPR-associated protein Cas4 [Streptomyces mobaraensis NBRC 13819 = DSM 40847]QTT76416.1 type I-E CRISPR-associated protein Cas7/Cse4/CasC [Streptomyces mobaraensis NBRC 13819 = DSM 40847]
MPHQPNLFVEIHILQSLPPSNINRDDSGTPKQALYGGARRARVSSQAWKRATRIEFAKDQPAGDQATRTKRIAALLTERLARPATDGGAGLDTAQSERLATALVGELGIAKSTKKDEQSAYLLFFGKRQLDTLVASLDGRGAQLAALPDADLKNEVKKLPVVEALATGHPAEVALFGRMVADLPKLNVDAAVQVAHALSTHAVRTEFDYYTAVDDENVEDSGAGMIGTVEFNSSTLYRYAVLGVHQLRDNLSSPEATRDAAKRFLDAFTRSMPTGHQNSFAHRTLPHLVLVTLRADQPVNLVSAFEKPVTGTSGLASESAVRLAEELRAVGTSWGTVPLRTLATYALGEKELEAAFGPSRLFPELLDEVDDLLETWLAGKPLLPIAAEDDGR